VGRASPESAKREPRNITTVQRKGGGAPIGRVSTHTSTGPVPHIRTGHVVSSDRFATTLAFRRCAGAVRVDAKLDRSPGSNLPCWERGCGTRRAHRSPLQKI
jgi:hypothetical protein